METLREAAQCELDARQLASFEVAARLEALLCYPHRSLDYRRNVAGAICADVVSQMIYDEPNRRSELRIRYPQYLKSDNRTSLGSLMKNREAATRAGMGFLAVMKETATGKPSVLNGRVGQVSFGAIGRFLNPAREQGAEINYKDRLHDWQADGFRRYYPVAHLAAAYAALARRASFGEQATSFNYHDFRSIKLIVGTATLFAQHIRATPKLAAAASQLVLLDMRE